MKLKYFLLTNIVFTLLLCMLFFIVITNSDDEEKNNSNIELKGLNFSDDVLSHMELVKKYTKEYEIVDYENYILAIMEVESSGKGNDVMQSSESLGLPPNSLTVEESIKQGCKYFSSLLKSSTEKGTDINTVIQAYNYGGEFVDFISSNGKKYSFELAQKFSKSKSDGKKINYKNPVSIPINGGWRYTYGNMFYVQLVSQYLVVASFDNLTVQKIMNEALKYRGWEYVFGGDSPTTSFDCSGLTQWCYDKAGIQLPRTAQEQYDSTQHISLKHAKAGDLVFFHSTYDTDSYITHVGIYTGNGTMYHAGNPIGYSNLSDEYWQAHIVGAGRVKYK